MDIMASRFNNLYFKKRQEIKHSIPNEEKNAIDTNTKAADLWFKPIPSIGRGSRGNIPLLGGRGRSNLDDTVFKN